MTKRLTSVVLFFVVIAVCLQLFFWASSYYSNSIKNHHLLFILTNADEKPALQDKFAIFIESLFAHLPSEKDKKLTIHMVVDQGSEDYVRQKISAFARSDVQFIFLNDQIVLQQVKPFVTVLQKYFSAKGSYDDDGIFYLSTVMHRLMPTDIDKLVQLDIDIMFERSVYELFDEFSQFDDDDLIGLAPEMQPVYYHQLTTFRQGNPDSRLGYPLPDGHPGFNSGAILLHIDRMRKSARYNEQLTIGKVDQLVNKYHLKGHLGVQDFFTLLNFEQADWFYQLDCGWNYQYCRLWLDEGGYGENQIGQKINQCQEPIKLHHGNCSSPIPGSASYNGDKTENRQLVKADVLNKPVAKKTIDSLPKPKSIDVSSKEFDVESYSDSRWQQHAKDDVIHLAIVACGNRLDETLVALKSAALLTETPLQIHLFADDVLRPQFLTALQKWPAYRQGNLATSLYSFHYPDVDETAWRKLFKPCASQRLFFPELIQGTDRVIYIDTDVLFLSSIDDIWAHFNDFSSEHLAALAPELESDNISRYKRDARHPYVAQRGINSGVMLMDLARMRKTKWLEEIIQLSAEYSTAGIPWGDQDLINIYFHEHPKQLYTYSCLWNYQPDTCLSQSSCQAANTKGIRILHGNRRAFQSESGADKHAAFKAVYQAFEQYPVNEPLMSHLLVPMQLHLKQVEQAPKNYCEQNVERYTKNLAKIVANMQAESSLSDTSQNFDLYQDTAIEQLQPWSETGITTTQLQQLATHRRQPIKYQIISGQLYRQKACLFPIRCKGIEHFLKQYTHELPDMEFYINVQDHPVSDIRNPLPIFSFSKIPGNHADILYPAWAFWQGGPALSVIKSWRWDKNRQDMLDSGAQTPWPLKKDQVFFRGSRTNDVRDELVLYALKHQQQWNVSYTLNQSQSMTDYVLNTLKLEPVEPVPLIEHCQYRYLLNFDGVAASFRLRNILACGALVLYANPEWVEFFYSQLKPWVHYVPLSSEAKEAQRILDLLENNLVLAEQIAKNGRDFIADHLVMTHVNHYWLTLLKEYARLQRFKPQLDTALLQIK
jgi:lipopolysaccharide biosynthesis glycosyltransferase